MRIRRRPRDGKREFMKEKTGSTGTRSKLPSNRGGKPAWGKHSARSKFVKAFLRERPRGASEKSPQGCFHEMEKGKKKTRKGGHGCRNKNCPFVLRKRMNGGPKLWGLVGKAIDVNGWGWPKESLRREKRIEGQHHKLFVLGRACRKES